jgi:ABC-type multidrug transport system permease subunit
MTRAVNQFMHLQFVSALQFNAVVALLPLYLIVDVVTYFYQQNWLIVAKKVVAILIIAGLLVLYAFRIANHFNWV